MRILAAARAAAEVEDVMVGTSTDGLRMGAGDTPTRGKIANGKGGNGIPGVPQDGKVGRTNGRKKIGHSKASGRRGNKLQKIVPKTRRRARAKDRARNKAKAESRPKLGWKTRS